jgi:mannose/fructose/N-acetylgalactosamine-specific phosphotransferase system component IIB
MPIVLCRVDERLIHGQVVVGWGTNLHVRRIVVADDELADSAWEQELYRAGVPDEVETEFLTLDAAADRIVDLEDGSERTILLLRDVDSLKRLSGPLAAAGVEVNLGGIHHAEGRQGVLPYLFLSASEREDLRSVGASGLRLSARDLPGSRRVSLSELVGSGE